MPVTQWNVVNVNGRNWLYVDVASFRIPLDWDPSSNMVIAIAAPDGGYGSFPALVKGDPGDKATLDTFIQFTPLEATDPTPDSAAWLDLGNNKYQLQLALHKGATGAPGGTVLHTASDLAGSGVPGKSIMVLNNTADGFVLASQKVGDRYYPSVINNTPTGQNTYPVTSIPVPAQPFDWRPDPGGWTVVTGTGPDVSVDYVARLGASNGADIGRATQRAGQYPATHTLMGGCPPNVADTYDRVAAGAGPTTIYFMVEKQGGGDSFTTTNSTTRAWVKVRPIL